MLGEGGASAACPPLPRAARAPPGAARAPPAGVGQGGGHTELNKKQMERIEKAPWFDNALHEMENKALELTKEEKVIRLAEQKEMPKWGNKVTIQRGDHFLEVKIGQFWSNVKGNWGGKCATQLNEKQMKRIEEAPWFDNAKKKRDKSIS